MGCRTFALLLALWSAGGIALALRFPDAYGALCLLLTGLSYVVSGAPGQFTANSMVDYSGKGHRSNLPVGCWPVAWVLDVATAPLQLPVLAPQTFVWARRRWDSLRVQLAQASPETVGELVRKAEAGGLAGWEYEALEEACREEGRIDPEDVPGLVDFFCREDYPRHAEAALVGLITKQEIAEEELRRIFTAQSRRGRHERYIRVLDALALHPRAPMSLLQDLRDLEGPGSYDRTARLRIEKARGGTG